MIPLTMARQGDSVRIKMIKGRDDARRHLENLGFVIGEEISIVNEISGDIILNVRGSRIGINKTMANRIMF